MNSVRRPRGKLPRRVYWTRRGLVLGVLVLLVFGVTRLFGGSGPDTTPTSAPVASPSAGLTPSASRPAAPVDRATAQATTKRHDRTTRGKHHRHRATPTPTPLALPTGPCANADVQVTPAVRRAYAGRHVTITLDLTTKTSAACTWEVSPKTVVVQLTSGSDQVWSSQDCPSSLGQHSVVVRQDPPTKVQLVWAGRRSDSSCSRSTLWAQPGWYHVEAAAYGAGPVDQQFHLLRPPRRTVYRTPKPHKKPTAASPTATPGANGSTGSSPSPTPSASPTS